MTFVEEDPAEILVRPYVARLWPDLMPERRSQRVRPYAPLPVTVGQGDPEQDNFTPKRAAALQAFHQEAETSHGRFGSQPVKRSTLEAIMEGLQRKL